MFVDFNKTFFPTKEDRDWLYKTIMRIQAEGIEESKRVKLVPEKRINETNTLLCAEPLELFHGDGRYCEYYKKSPYNFVEGGKCSKYNIACGGGFICEEKNKERILKYENG